MYNLDIFMAFLYMCNWMLRNQQMYLQDKKIVLWRENWLKEIIFNARQWWHRKCEVVMLWELCCWLCYIDIKFTDCIKFYV